MSFIDLTGKTFGDWTVLYRTENKGRRVMWRCVCKCGTKKDVAGSSLRSGKSNGCSKCIWERNSHPALHKDGSRRWINNKPTHIYSVWLGMKERCYNEKHKSYKNYGGRGVRMCEEWKNSFQSFFDFVSQLEHYGEPGRTIDRINNNGMYEPGNVRWSTRSEQEKNKRAKRL